MTAEAEERLDNQVLMRVRDLEAQLAERDAQIERLEINIKVQEALRRAVQKDANGWELIAKTDDLTGMANRRGGNEAFQEAAKRRRKLEQTTGEPVPHKFNVLFIDLDKFGQINKKHGDQTGDTALQVVAKTIMKCLRRTDIAFRKGGDEFIIGLEDSLTEGTNQIVTERLVKALDDEIEISAPDGTKLSIRGSIGIYEWNDNLKLEENFAMADEQMRANKAERRRRELWANPDFSRPTVTQYSEIRCSLG